eukprot:TRINITY_DN66311_c4_g14_i1.p2 TRINITY_DN66311_c4_g14~~TRINITY_DN66311_c4_g14_i1.p2  ORF type:complete len:394 (-),score=196.53 TRINITY_DN66311_c4_g14_i1:53-1234(-)
MTAAAPYSLKGIRFSDAFVGVSLAVAGVIFSSFATVIIKVAHRQQHGVPKEHREPAYKRSIWWVIVALYICDALLDFVAYGFAPMSLLAPTSALSIAFNAVIAYYLLHEKLDSRALVGTGMILVGSMSAVSVGSRQPADHTLETMKALFLRPGFVVFIVTDVLLLSALYFLVVQLRPVAAIVRRKKQAGQRPTAKEMRKHVTLAVSYAFLVSSIASWTNLLAKVFVELISSFTHNHFDLKLLFSHALTWIALVTVVVLSAVQLMLLSDMMRLFEAVVIVPIYQCLFILCLITYGGAYFEEFSNVEAVRVIIFILCVLVSFAGIVMLDKASSVMAPPEEDYNTDAGDTSDDDEEEQQQAHTADDTSKLLDNSESSQPRTDDDAQEHESLLNHDS